jgi:two-component system response regulator FlrC
MKPQLLLVEDDDALREALESTLRRGDCDVTAVATAEAGLAVLQHRRPALVLSDIRLPGMDGLTLVQTLRANGGQTPVVLMTAHADVPLALAALKSGASDLLLKPFCGDTLMAAVHRYARPACAGTHDSGLLARDEVMRAVLTRAERVAGVDATVLLTGESGVGKEVMARHIHTSSTRAKRPFIAVNCAAIPESLLESALFGHEKGAFTGASRPQPGKFEQADGGTLFLDEIGELPYDAQAKLLRVLQERCVERVGSQLALPIDIRLIAATNRDLQACVAAGRFREDLFYRLAVFPLAVPPLRARPGDVLPLAAHFLHHYAARFGIAAPCLLDDAQDALMRHRWPGNVRELENAVQRGLLLSDNGRIGAAHLELAAASVCLPLAAAALPLAMAGEPATAPAATPASPPAAAADSAPAALDAGAVGSPPRNVRDMERQHILSVLAQTQGNRREAIAILGISERTLRYKLKAYRAQEASEAGDRDPYWADTALAPISPSLAE